MNLEPVIIKEIPNFPRYYVDIYGKVYSKKVSVNFKSLKLSMCFWGYKKVLLRRDKKVSTKLVSWLVLETFVGPRPEGMVACHGVKGNLDDSLDNLSWGTWSKNCGEDRVRDGTINRGEKHGLSVLNEQQVLEIRRLYGVENLFQEEIAKRFNISRGNVQAILSKRSWAWL